MTSAIAKSFYQVIINSLSTPQVEYLGERLDRTFNLYKVSGFSSKIPIPRQTAAETLVLYFQDEEELVQLFSIMLRHEGEYFYNRELAIWGKDDFIALLKKNKWVYDPDLHTFLRDPFYEHAINFLKSIRLLDLRLGPPDKETIDKITDISKKMQIKDLEWRITMRLYDLEDGTGELIRKVLGLLLARQNLQMFTTELYFCLKELAVNASKANYKILFQKHMAPKLGLKPNEEYVKFLLAFKKEIEDNGNSNLLALAKKEDRNYTLIFQSSHESIEIWVTNPQNISAIEKSQLMKKLYPTVGSESSFAAEDDEYVEGAGMGLMLILNVLKKYSKEKTPLKVIFYPDFIKIGFSLKRTDLAATMPKA